MIGVTETGYRAHHAVPATLSSVDALCRDVSHELADGVYKISPEDVFRLQLVLREALNNAVIHGAKYDPREKVYCDVRLRGESLTVCVTDGGDGFDWRSIMPSESDPLRDSGFGLQIMSKYAGSFKYNRKGNRLLLEQRLIGGGSMSIQDDIQAQSKTVVVPDADVVAATAPTLRTQVRMALNESAGGLVVDLRNVRNIDSSGIGILVAAHNSLAKSGMSLEIINASADLIGLFRTLRLDQHFTISGDDGEL